MTANSLSDKGNPWFKCGFCGLSVFTENEFVFHVKNHYKTKSRKRSKIQAEAQEARSLPRKEFSVAAATSLIKRDVIPPNGNQHATSNIPEVGGIIEITDTEAPVVVTEINHDDFTAENVHKLSRNDTAVAQANKTRQTSQESSSTSEICETNTFVKGNAGPDSCFNEEFRDPNLCEELSEISPKKHQVRRKTINNRDLTRAVRILNRIFHCCRCEFKTSIEQNFKDHLLEEHNSNFTSLYLQRIAGNFIHECRICNSVFFNARSLTAHFKKWHNGHMSSRYKCNECPYSTYCYPTLKRHMSIHLPEKWWKCSLCDYAGVDKSYLTKHVKNMHGSADLDFSQIEKS